MRPLKAFLLANTLVVLTLSAAHGAPVAGPSAAAPATAVTAAPQPLDAGTLAQDLTLLIRLANISLTGEQLDKLVAVYPANFSEQAKASDAGAAQRAKLTLTDQETQTLTSIRERLIAGGLVAPHQLQVAWKTIGGRRAPNSLPVGLASGDLVGQIAAVLTPEQVMGILRPLKNQLRARKQPGPLVEPVLARLAKLRDGDDDHWAAGVEDIATSGAAQAGPPDSDAYKQTCQDLKDCFARTRKMNDKQFADGQAELLENLRALFPPDYDPAADVTLTARQRRQALTYLFLCPRTPVLLQEMRRAHAGQ